MHELSLGPSMCLERPSDKALGQHNTTSMAFTTPAANLEHSPLLLVAAAWSVVGSRWFYKDEIAFQVGAGTPNTTLPVNVHVGPEISVRGLLGQIEKQVGEAASCMSICNENPSPHAFTVRFEQSKSDSSLIKCLTNHWAIVSNSESKNLVTLYCALQLPTLALEVKVSTDSLPEDEVARLARTLQTAFEQLAGKRVDDVLLPDIDMVHDHDILDIWKRNANVPQGAQNPVHETIQQRAKERPEATAVCAWDGEFSYRDLDHLSTQIALGLIRKGVKNNKPVPLYFDKSKWMPVAILAVLKAGGSFLQLATTIPRGRTQTLLDMNKPSLALVSETAPDWLSELVQTFTIKDLMQDDRELALPQVSQSEDAVYLFTSGSTGQPKGIVWTHEALATNCEVIGQIQSMGPQTRHFQTASYEFDVSMMETIAVLLSGSCLCVPREKDGINCSPAALESLQGNSAYLTPTLAENLDPDTVPCLKSLALEGEILPKDIVSKWAGRVTMFNFYGPAECPHPAACVIDPASFRTGFAGSTSVALRWVVDPHNHEKLLPPGAIGELLVEGPILLDRYVGNVPNTKPFISPTWLQRGCANFPGRQGKLFKTGDLVRCDRNGDILVIGRKDSQVQIHGERVELSEVEHNVRRFMNGDVNVAAEMITPAGCDKPILAAFLAIGGDQTIPSDDSRKILEALTVGLERMASHVPQTFIPASYIAVEAIPKTLAGKTNRRFLREIGASMTLEQLNATHLCRI